MPDAHYKLRGETPSKGRWGLTDLILRPAAAAYDEALLQPVLDERLALLFVEEQGLAARVTHFLVKLGFRHLKKWW
jgi:hypothetical protein